MSLATHCIANHLPSRLHVLYPIYPIYKVPVELVFCILV